MAWIVRNLWLIPALPIFAAALGAVANQRQRRFAAGLAIGAISSSFLLALWAFVVALQQPARQVQNFAWFELGTESVRLGWLLDPLTSIMLLMVTFAALLIFIYSVGYMAHDANIVRYFCFLSLFAGAMLTIVIANSLLLLFMGWEVVGLSSYLLIGFWYDRPAAAAAAKKAFITTRIGDIGLLLGMVWLYGQTGTLLFYDHGAGCLEHSALSLLVAHGTAIGMAASTGISLLIFSGAVGKSGQVPLHVWLPDAMEGPTPVSALIHAATMVAAGVFLVARVYPLMSASLPFAHSPATTLKVVTWIGAITAFFAACIAVAQNDIKRILAYSTVSQLGYMMMGLGVGGVAVGIFHLITHAFFKALLFLGAGSVIHGCTEEQDIRNMGGLGKFMPLTFATYGVGMLALCGFPFFFSGFWSKDEILYAAHGWGVSRAPFYLGAVGALLTALYMTRQIYYVFLGTRREAVAPEEPVLSPRAPAEYCILGEPHESPAVMTAPLTILAVLTLLLGFVGTPAWPWFQAFLEGHSTTTLVFGRFTAGGILPLMVTSSLIVFAGLALGWWLYGRTPIRYATEPDVLERLQPTLFRALQQRLYVDEFYELTVIGFFRWCSRLGDWTDRNLWSGAAQMISHLVTAAGSIDTWLDGYVVNSGFDEGCRTVLQGGRLMSRLQNGRVQSYLRILGIALAAFAVFLFWGIKG